MKLARATHIRASTMAMFSPVTTDITSVCSVFSSPARDHMTWDETVSGPSSTGGSLGSVRSTVSGGFPSRERAVVTWNGHKGE